MKNDNDEDVLNGTSYDYENLYLEFFQRTLQVDDQLLKKIFFTLSWQDGIKIQENVFCALTLLQEAYSYVMLHPKDFYGAYQEVLSSIYQFIKYLFQYLSVKIFNASLSMNANFANDMFAQWCRCVAGIDSLDSKNRMQDRRFRSEEWEKHPFFYNLFKTHTSIQDLVSEDIRKQYTIFEKQHIKTGNANNANVGCDVKNDFSLMQKKSQFFIKQFLDCFSPYNFPLTNPDLLEKTIDERGKNLVIGMQKLLNDVRNAHGFFLVPLTDTQAFRVGKDVADSDGWIVFKNDLVELIWYAPAGEKVYREPILIIPPWINKFYILDLGKRKSFVRWCLSHGYSVFMISWVNPGSRLGHKTFEDYLQEGILDVLDVVQSVTGSSHIHTVGYCIAGTLLGCVLAYLSEESSSHESNAHSRVIKTATFLATQFDFEEAGDLQIFIDKQQLDSLDERMKEAGGILQAPLMMQMFQCLRSRDLIWIPFVKTYLLGENAKEFDLLFWNSDITNIPSAVHSFYLRNFYLENNFSKGKIFLKDKNLLLSNIDQPSYFVSTKEDHIAPCHSVFESFKRVGARDKTFVLADSGHIAGIIYPPPEALNKKKYSYMVGALDASQEGRATASSASNLSLEEWKHHAETHEGSWWENWISWLSCHADPNKVTHHYKDYKNNNDKAPGRYVHVKWFDAL